MRLVASLAALMLVGCDTPEPVKPTEEPEQPKVQSITIVAPEKEQVKEPAAQYKKGDLVHVKIGEDLVEGAIFMVEGYAEWEHSATGKKRDAWSYIVTITYNGQTGNIRLPEFLLLHRK